MGLRPFGDEGTEPLPAPPPNNAPIMAAALGTLRDASKSSVFWILFATFFICGASTNGLVQVHLIPMCLDFGIPQVQAASLLAAMGIFDFVGTIASGWLSDRYDNRKLLFWYYGLRGLSLLFLPFSDFTLYGLSLFAMFYGLDWIATVPPTVRLTAQRFGAERANLVFGWIFAGHQLGAGTAAFGAGLSRTMLQTYLPAFFVAGALCIVAALIVLAISRPTPSGGVGAPHPEERASRASRRMAAGEIGASWFETREDALLTMRDEQLRPRRHVARRPDAADRLRQTREFAQQRTRLAGIDDLLDPEFLGRTKRRTQLVEAILDLFQLRGRVVRGVDVGAVGRLDAAFQRQRAPIGRRPGIAHRIAVGRLVHDARHAERVAHDDGAPGHGRSG